MILRYALVILVVAGLAKLALADFGGLPIPRVFASPSNTSYFRLVPPQRAEYNLDETIGFAYRADWPEDELLYTTQGWYSEMVLVSDDGDYLARRGMWPSDKSSPKETLAIAFYARGVEVKTYSVADLVDDLSALRYSVSHYSWGGQLQWRRDYNWNSEVEVITVEDRLIRFDIQTGAIVDCRHVQDGASC